MFSRRFPFSDFFFSFSTCVLVVALRGRIRRPNHHGEGGEKAGKKVESVKKRQRATSAAGIILFSRGVHMTFRGKHVSCWAPEGRSL